MSHDLMPSLQNPATGLMAGGGGTLPSTREMTRRSPSIALVFGVGNEIQTDDC